MTGSSGSRKRPPAPDSGGRGGADGATPGPRREVVGILLLAISFAFLLALIPAELLWPERFPSGNLMGRAGGGVARALAWVAGPAVAVLLPLLLGCAALAFAGWYGGVSAIRTATLLGGLLFLLPPLLRVAGVAPEAVGVIGRELGGVGIHWFGRFGTGVLTVGAMVALSVGTLRWNPLVPLGRWTLRGVRGMGWALAGGGRLAARGTRGVLAAGRGAAPSPTRKLRRDPGRTALPAAGAHVTFPPPEGSGGEREDGLAPAEEGAEWLIPDAEEASAAPPRARSETPRGSPPPPSSRSGAEVVQGGLFPDPLPEEARTGQPLPPLDLLTPPAPRDRAGMDRELDRLGEVLIEKLRTFQVESSLSGRTTGPVVTQFEVIPAPGVKVNRIANLEADLALAMKARSIRIVAPIPGKGAVGVEIPNPRPEPVSLREILEAPAFQQSRAELPLALGKDLAGEPYVADLARMPHALIAGATGSGKSVCLNTVITSLVYRHTPETLRLLMVDPKMVELSIYADLPHLRHPVVTDPKEAAGVLKWAVLEMERRYALLSANGVRSLGDFNKRVRDGGILRRSEVDGPDGEEGDPDRWVYSDGILPYIVLVVDELADLMMAVQSEVERPLTLLAQKARAIGIHIILATQRPSVNVITGLIKANFPCRIAFRVASKTDSRTILDQNGADALLGNGDMLFLPPGQSEPGRLQGAYIPTEDTDRITRWFRDRELERRARALETGEWVPAAEQDILEVVRAMEAKEGGGEEDDAISGDWDEMFRAAAEVCIQHSQGSTSLLQRRLKLGYGRAARIMDQLEQAGVLGAADGSKPREVLMTLDQLDRMFSGGVGEE